MGRGSLTVKLFTAEGALPVRNGHVLIKDAKGNLLYALSTDENGISQTITMEAPDRANSTSPYTNRPRFSICDVEAMAEGFQKEIVRQVAIFDGIITILSILKQPLIDPLPRETQVNERTIPLVYGVDIDRTFLPEQPMLTKTDGYRIMALPEANEVRIPQDVTVHLGAPESNSRNVRVPFIDYVKNVACSEILPTWEESALRANILAQISFVLNRIYTLWYRSQGYDFDITNSTAYDQFFVEGRGFFNSVSRVADEIFNQFTRRAGRREPFFAQYCNGTTSRCPGLSQWGSQDLALRGYTPIEILHAYYPEDLQIVESNNIAEVEGIYPGVALRMGSTGEAVRRMQRYLNRISGNFYIPHIPVIDGIFGPATEASVKAFQSLRSMVPDGIIGKETWYEITELYVAVRQFAELTSEGERIGIGTTPPTSTIRLGARGEDVVELQFILNYIAEFNPSIPFVIENGVFREDTETGVREFQRNYGLAMDGIVGPATWQKLYDVYNSFVGTVQPEIPPSGTPVYPGTPLRTGSTGSNVLLMQNYLNEIAQSYPDIPRIAADGIFGPATHAAVVAFQRRFGLTADGIIGPLTWSEIARVYQGLGVPTSPDYPGTPLRVGSRGGDVSLMQEYLNAVRAAHPSIPELTVDGIFGTRTERAVREFQRLFGLTADGIIGPVTWGQIVEAYNRMA